MPSQTFKSRMREFAAALGEHLHKAELIAYGSLLIVGVIQIVIRERFPDVRPSWPLIGGSLMIVLFGVVLVPPVLLIFRVWKKPDAEKHEPRS